MSTPPRPNIRVDKWLWHARFFKTRSTCAKLINDGRVRVNEVRITKPSILLYEADVLTFSQAEWVRVIKVAAISTRRGPAPEAQLLYDDLSSPRPTWEKRPENPRYEGKGRPTGKDRRALSSFSSKSLD